MKTFRTDIEGFTITEVIIVIVLIGIVGVVAFARFMSGSAFNASGAQSAIISMAHAAQQASLGRPNTSFEIDTVGDDWVFSVVSGSPTVTIRSLNVSSTNVVLETGSPDFTINTCANDFDTPVANDFRIIFDTKGDLVSFTNNTVTETVDASFNGVRICVNDDVSLSVCVSPAGYTHEGNCDA